MKHPGMRDIGDVAAKLFPRFSRTAREVTSAMLIINSVLTMGYHIFTGGKSECLFVIALTATLSPAHGRSRLAAAGPEAPARRNATRSPLTPVFSTLADGRVCTVVWQVITMAASILFSLPRRLDHASVIGTSSVITMSITILLSLIFAGIQDHPYRGYGGPDGLTEYPGLGPVKTHGGFPNPDLSFVDGFNAVLK